MKNFIPALISILFCINLFAQTAIMPASTKAIIQVIEKDLGHDRSIPSKSILDFYPIYKMKGQYQIAVLCKVNAQFNKEQAIRDGYDVGAVIGNIVSMRMPLNRLHEGFSYPGIEYIESAEKMAPELDGALKDTRADLVHKGLDLPQPHTGKGVLIGIADWGFDYTHPMFYDTTLDHTRILAAWDQVKTIGTPPVGFSHGALYSDPDQLALAQHDTISALSDYHGTHVAGIAGGSGGGTKYRGIGFESNFLFSQMRNDLSSSLDAFTWMKETADAQGKRLVINNSWGNYRVFPLDGSSLVSQAIDELSYEGVVFIFSAGNNGNINFHLKKTFIADSVRTRIMGFDYINDHDLWGEAVSMWGEPAHPFAVQLRILNDQNAIVGQSDLWNTDTAIPYLDTFLIVGPDTVFYHVTTDASHPLNGRPQMTLDIKNTNPALKNILYAEAPNGTVHFWNTRLTVYGVGNWGYGFTAPASGYKLGDKNYGVGHPGVTTSVITAAAHKTNFLLTDFSSYGPRMDDVLKPDISAPGQDICSSFNSFAKENLDPVTSVNFNGKDFEFVRLSGTSMSGPMVTGVAALILEANPYLSPADVKAIIINSAREDNLTGDIGPEGSNRWGFGKLDAYNAIQSIFGTTVGDVSKNEHQVFPIPAHDQVFISGDWVGNESYRLININGTVITRGHFNGSMDVSQVPNGMYVLSVEGEKGVEVFRVLIH